MSLAGLVHDQRIDEVLYFGDGTGLDDMGIGAEERGLPGITPIGCDMDDARFCSIPGAVAGDGDEDCRLIPAAASQAILCGQGDRNAKDVFHRAVLDVGVHDQRDAALDPDTDFESA